METPERICPVCSSAIHADVSVCCFCQYDLKNNYSILRDGLLYGVVIGDEIAIGNVESFRKAQKLAFVLNRLKKESTLRRTDGTPSKLA